MPELPEAETIARGLRPSIVGRRITEVEIIHEDVLPQGRDAFREIVRGRTIDDVGRRGKNLVLTLDDEAVLLVNLGMTGKLLPVDHPDGGGFEGETAGGDPDPGRGTDAGIVGENGARDGAVDNRPTHSAVRFLLEGGGALVYDDIRRFGRVEALDPGAWQERSRSLGPEPLDPGLDSTELASRLGTSRSPIRTILLDQKRIAGVGNIYANEALHRARIHPHRPARSLEEAEFARLLTALRELMVAAIDAGGTTIRDYRNASGRPGRYSRQLRVYDREGQPCQRCGEPVERIVFGNRSAFLCPRCQPAEGA